MYLVFPVRPLEIQMSSLLLTITLVFPFISTDNYQIQEISISSFLLIILLAKISLSDVEHF